jgi:long-chain fatty acid transport protein|tara:strand:+ start:11228 stop:12535 length:1308 start_codon:yes stop_codon:yes gene_type:complete
MNFHKKHITIAFITYLSSTAAFAGPYGFDLHNVLSPKAASMAGTTIAGEGSGPVEAVYGNPANLTDLKGGTNFTFGATLYYPEVHAKHDGSVTGAGSESAYDTTSSTQVFTIPQIAVTQDLAALGVPLVFGAGLSVVSGIGVDWRDNPNALGAAAEYVVFGINSGIGYSVNEQLDLGAALTISYATLEAGVAGSSAQSHDYGFRGTLGADYHPTAKTDIGFYYQTQLSHTFDNMMQLKNGVRAGAGVIANVDDRSFNHEDVTVTQPSNYALGVSHQVTDQLRIASDFIYKEWSEAKFWDNFYEDQQVVSLGVEYKTKGPLTLRAGYGWASDPTDEITKGKTLEGFNALCTGIGKGTCFSLDSPQVWNWLQAMETPVIYKHRITTGFSYEGFLAPFITLDVHAAYQLPQKREYQGSGTTLDVRSYHGGFALTWKFS